MFLFFVLSRYAQNILFHFQTIYLLCIYLFYPDFGVPIMILIIYILRKLENCFIIFFTDTCSFHGVDFFLFLYCPILILLGIKIVFILILLIVIAVRVSIDFTQKTSQCHVFLMTIF